MGAIFFLLFAAAERRCCGSGCRTEGCRRRGDTSESASYRSRMQSSRVPTSSIVCTVEQGGMYFLSGLNSTFHMGILQISRKMLVPYNDPDAANSRLEILDDYVAFGAAAAREPTRTHGGSHEKLVKARTRGNAFLGSLVMNKSGEQKSASEGRGLVDQSDTFGFEPESLNFILTLVR